MINNSKLSDIDLFFIRLKHGWISEEKKKILYDLVISLKNATELQKERFILIYNLKSENNIRYNLSSLARKQNCFPSAIKYSISRIRNFLINLNDDRKDIFLKLIKDDDYFFTNKNK